MRNSAHGQSVTTRPIASWRSVLISGFVACGLLLAGATGAHAADDVTTPPTTAVTQDSTTQQMLDQIRAALGTIINLPDVHDWG
jgi:hypothetical protein